MRSRFALLLALILSAGALAIALSSHSQLSAVAPGCPTSFNLTLTIDQDEIRSLGIVPPGRTLYIKDLLVNTGVPNGLLVLVDGVEVAPPIRMTSEHPHASFAVGFKVRAGQEAAIYNSEASSRDVFIAGTLE